jgi:aminoglycoside 3-N-acetyltransferase
MRASDEPVTADRLVTDLRALGVRPGDTVLVHASLRGIGWTVGGAQAAVEALLAAVGPAGTVVVPALTAGNTDPHRWAATRGEPVPEAWWPVVRAHLPAFDPAVTASSGVGVIAEAVRTWPGAVRSTHPQTSFAAVGARAGELLAVHDLDCHYGARSPLGALVSAGAQGLLLGVGWDVCTTFHHAEYLVADPPVRTYECVVGGAGGRRWVTFDDVLLDDGDFADLGKAFEFAEGGAGTGVVHSGVVGRAEARRFPLAAAVAFAERWLRTHRPS